MDNDDKILITIDARETNLYNDIINRDLDNYKDKIEIISENLILGDIHITYKNLTHIFERKLYKIYKHLYKTVDIKSRKQDYYQMFHKNILLILLKEIIYYHPSHMREINL